MSSKRQKILFSAREASMKVCKRSFQVGAVMGLVAIGCALWEDSIKNKIRNDNNK